jgi:ParB family transcriptional regulator, chromosome partitioning protein
VRKTSSARILLIQQGHLRVREPHRQRRLLTSLAESGQQTPIVVVACQDNRERYLVIDGHKRVAALEQLGRDIVEATLWPMSEAEALLLSRSLRSGPQESALEEGWLLAEMEQRFGYGLDELARRFGPQHELGIAAPGAGGVAAGSDPAASPRGQDLRASGMKCLVPVGPRGCEKHCERMAAAFATHHCDTRQAGQLYTAWRKAARAVRERILDRPYGTAPRLCSNPIHVNGVRQLLTKGLAF